MSRPADVPAAPYSALAIVALVLAFAVPPGGVVCGVIARRQIRTTGEQGDGVALAGVVVGAVLSALIALVVLLWFAVLGATLLGFLAVLQQIPRSTTP